VYIILDSMYMTVSVSTGLYCKLDLLNVNKLHYIILHYIPMTFKSLYVLLPVSSSNTIDIRDTREREREREGGGGREKI